MNYRQLVPDREQRGIMWMVIGLVVAVPMVFAVILAFKVAVTALVFMVCTWLIHHVIDVVPALGFWASVALTAGLWTLGLAIKLVFWLLLGGSRA